jgi:hypothetical protein
LKLPSTGHSSKVLTSPYTTYLYTVS